MLAKWYIPEVNSAAALRLKSRFKPPSVLTHLHRLELQNAWQLKVHRGELTAEAAARAAERLQSDVEAGVWSVPDYDLALVFTAAAGLARKHSVALGTRSLDILHVAMAMALAEKVFVTGDARQVRLAKEVGLEVVALA